MRTPCRIPYTIFGVFLCIAEGHGGVELMLNGVEIDRLSATARRERFAIRDSRPKARIEALSTENVAAVEGYVSVRTKVEGVAPVALDRTRRGRYQGQSVATEEKVDLVDLVYVSVEHFSIQ